MTEPAVEFLDVATLLETSQPRRSGVRVWQIAGTFLFIVLLSTYIGSRGPAAERALNAVSGLVMIGLVGVMGWISWSTFRKAREEQMRIEAIEELIRLRRWPEAGMMLQQMLSQPTRTQQARAGALIFLSNVLARYNRFDDAIAVQDYLLENYALDGGTAHGLRLARAIAMLREDHLHDADRAINELRRQVSRAGRAMNENADEDDEESEPGPREIPQSLSAGLALVEIYRDVKTGHPQEAIELFNATLPSLREQLGHRVADAHMLIAKAHDLLGQEREAQLHYENATLLAPAGEITRRYPETAGLAQKYQPAEAPRGAA
jgi:tetratricopeptide (TPR) repeat protein